jgi:hypothetical protein
MTANVVTFPNYPVDEVRELTGISPKHEEGGRSFMFSEQIQESRSECLARPVVKGQSKDTISGHFPPGSVHTPTPPYDGRKVGS